MTALDETSCQLPCQHPSCWASQRRQEKGVPRKLPPIVSNRTTSPDDADLPMQSICNLLNEYGKSESDLCPEFSRMGYLYTRATGTQQRTVLPLRTRYQRKSVRIRERNGTCKSNTGNVYNSCLHLIEAADSIEKDIFSCGLEEPGAINHLYVWLPNNKKMQEKHKSKSLENKNPHQFLLKDVTECMLPEEVGHKRQNNILFADWPTLKKKHACRRHQRKFSVRQEPFLSLDVIFQGSNSSQNYQTSKWHLKHDNEIAYSNQHSSTHGKLTTRSARLLNQHKENISDQVLPDIYRRRELTIASQQTDCQSKLTAVSLELPDFLTYAQRAKPFSYANQDFDFSLGPVPVSLSRYQKRFDENSCEHVPRVESNTSNTSLLQPRSANSDVEKFITPEYSQIETKITDQKPASVLRSAPIQELQQAGQYSSDSHTDWEAAIDLRSDPPRTSERRLQDQQKVADTDTTSLGEDRTTAGSPAPPPPSPEPRG